MPRPLPSADAPEAAHEVDPVLWAGERARLPREGRPGELDLADPIDEGEDGGDARRDAIESRLTVLLAHLLKWSHQPGARPARWRAAICGPRERIARTIREASSLSAHPGEVFAERCRSGRLLAPKETGIDFTVSPLHRRAGPRSGLHREASGPRRPTHLRSEP